jgi:protein involved in polysaccharide export with SLBB domain
MLLFALSAVQAQIPQDLINKAKAAGMTDAQIQQEINKRMGGATGAQNASNAVTGTDQKVERMPDVAKIQDTSITTTVIEEELPKKDFTGTIYGQEIFSNSNLSFTPNLEIPTPVDYILAAGDEVLINVWGASELNMTQTISPEGVINIPNVGPVSLSGLTVDQASERIKQQLGRIMSDIVSEDEPNTFVSVSLGKIRSIAVNIVGEASQPGTYTLPSLATLFNALHAAGGVNDIGTLRNIKVFRNSKLVATLDVYDYLQNGKSDSNIRLENDDLILIEPYESHISTGGKLKRNRIFELKKDETLNDLIELAGGFKGDAFSENIQVIRNNGDRISIATVTADEFDTFKLLDNDAITVDSIIPIFNNRVTVRGAVWRPRAYELSSETNSVKQLIEKAAGVKGDQFMGRAQITRLNKDFTKKIIAVDIKGILNGTSEDIILLPEDELYIPSIEDLREKYTINVLGAVNDPDETFEYRNNMTVEDAIILAGGLQESASNVHVEVARRVKDSNATNDGDKVADLFDFVLNPNLEIIKGQKAFELMPFDQVFVRFSPGYQKQRLVEVKGEALFRGSYALSKKNQRLSDIITQAGGVTKQAYLKGANLRRKLSDDELLRLKTTLRVAENLSSQDSTNLTELRETGYSIGINLEKALAVPGGLDDVVLRDGDILEIPEFQSTVKVSGSVVYPNSVTYEKGMNVRDCLTQAGGYTESSRKYPVVVYMNGKVGATKKVFFFFKKYPKIEPGCEILVPMKRYKDNSMLWPQIMGITNSTISMAAILSSVLRP